LVRVLASLSKASYTIYINSCVHYFSIKSCVHIFHTRDKKIKTIRVGFTGLQKFYVYIFTDQNTQSNYHTKSSPKDSPWSLEGVFSTIFDLLPHLAVNILDFEPFVASVTQLLTCLHQSVSLPMEPHIFKVVIAACREIPFSPPGKIIPFSPPRFLTIFST